LGGAIAFLASDGTCTVHDMATLTLARGGRTKGEVDAHAFAALLRQEPIDHVFVERVGAMPGQGTSSMFAMGKATGIVIGALAALGLPLTLISPVTWKRALQVPAAKDGARARASQLLPGSAAQWARVKDHGRAEAALIALYGVQNGGPKARVSINQGLSILDDPEFPNRGVHDGQRRAP
jgi:crossover junction endodeoxyribonuclease RuvC